MFIGQCGRVRAARRAAETARKHQQALVLWRDGQIVHELCGVPDYAELLQVAL